jgi:hypothetical protein
MIEMEHSGSSKKSLFCSNKQRQMEQFKLLIIPEYQYCRCDQENLRVLCWQQNFSAPLFLQNGHGFCLVQQIHQDNLPCRLIR